MKVILDVSAVTCVKNHITPANNIVPGIISALGPNLSKSFPETGESRPFNKLPGSIIRPVA